MRVFNIHSVAKYPKIEGDPLGSLKSQKAEKEGSLIVPKEVESFYFGIIVKPEPHRVGFSF